MDRTYILFSISTAENCVGLKGTKITTMYPYVAGSQESVEKELARIVDEAKKKGRKIEEVTSDEINMGQYFESMIVKIESKIGGPDIFGISSVWTV